MNVQRRPNATGPYGACASHEVPKHAENSKNTAPATWSAYDRDLLRALRIQAPSETPGRLDPKLLSTGLTLHVAGRVMLTLWIAYLVRGWD